MHGRIAISSSVERRIRREERSATLRERALALRQAGWIYAAIGEALGVSVTRAWQIVRKAERLIRERSKSEKGTPARERPSDSNNDPLASGPSNGQALCVYRPPTT